MTSRGKSAALQSLGAVALVALAGCKHDSTSAPSATTITSATVTPEAPPIVVSKTAKLAATAMSTIVYATPADTAKKIGYLRLGAVVPRTDKSYGIEGCPGGWYGIAPRGFVCVGKNATLDMDSPIIRAASVRPDTSKPLPYSYGFIRAVAPLYLRIPSKDEQLATEFKLTQHLAFWNRKGKQANHPDHIGANDTAREIIPDAPAPPPSSTRSDAILLGATSDADPPPFWLAGGRTIPNVSGFDVPAKAIFANRVRRHTGIAFLGSFATGAESENRAFAVTVDMRLIPMDKIKPEPASPFHGVELKGDVKLPLAFARPCNPNAKGTPLPCVHTYRDDGGELKKTDDVLPTRGLLQLTGAQRTGKKNARFLEATGGAWVRATDVGVAVVPDPWPQAAQRGEKWVDVSIEDQTLVLWEGKTPVYATVVSTGQDGLDDPKKTKATPRGTFRIKSKHITTTMDSNGRSAQSGGAAPESGETGSPTDDDKHAGNFELRDVPYVQYFQDGYALHSAYWHDHFGLARSHGCINMAPIDALRVFRFTDPPVPEGWHGMNVESGKGTMVVIHR